MIYTAFIMGLIGSLHCMGMCGPISMLLPSDPAKRNRYLIGRLIYNGGRIVTYTILGFLVGIIGEEISGFTSQKYLSIIIGVVILLVFIIPQKWISKLSLLPHVNRFNNLVKSSLSIYYKKYSLLSQFTFGLLNGLLPCGMVYAALSGAFLMNHLWQSMLFMTLFGLGTLPMMLSFSFLGSMVRKLFTFKPKLIYTVSYLVLAIWLIFRGITLPSKSLEHTPEKHTIPVCYG